MTTKDKKTDEEKLAEAQLLAQAILVDRPDIHFIQVMNRFATYNPVTYDWHYIAESAFKMGFPKLSRPLNWDCFKQLLVDNNRIKETTTYCASREGPKDPLALNLIDPSCWIQPEDLTSRRTLNTKWFDYLIESLGNNEPEQMEHLMQCVGWKWLHPEDFMLPCACFYGQGGAGKQVLMMIVMGTIFSPSVVKESPRAPDERFNEKMGGSLVYTFNEQITERTSSESLKQLVQNQTLEIEEKYQPKKTVSSTAWYCVTTNSPSGAVKLENNDSKRRYSLLKLESTLLEVVQRHNPELSEEEASSQLDNACKHIYRARTEVCVFLSQCVDACKGLTSAPKALHGKNLKELQENTSDACQQVCEEVFVDFAEFGFITDATLYNLYKAKVSEFGQLLKAKTKFVGEVQSFIRDRKLPINFKIKAYVELRRANVFYNREKGEFKSVSLDNKAEYERGHHLHCSSNIVPIKPTSLKSLSDNIINLNTHKGEQE